MNELFTECGKNYRIKPDDKVKKTEFKATGNIEIKHISNTRNSFNGIKKLNKYEYLVLETGEIKKYKQGVNKSEKGLKKSMRNLKYILKNNFSGAKNELFITLTSRDAILNIKDIKENFDRFWRKLKSKFLDLEFVAVFEKSLNNKGWHIHMLVKAVNHKKLNISNKTIEKIWAEGYTKTSRITRKIGLNDINENDRMIYKNKFTETFGIDRVISYLCKTEGKEKIATGERTYKTSRGIQKAKTNNTEYATSRKEMGQNYILDKEYTSLIRDKKTNKIVNKVKIENWKPKK